VHCFFSLTKKKLAKAALALYIFFSFFLSYLSGNASPYRIYVKDTGPLYAALATLPRLLSTTRL
jgi:hypothetical protein